MKILYILISAILLFTIIACDEDKILEEVPLDFASPENSYINLQDFNAGIYSLYDLTRNAFSEQERSIYEMLFGTDIGFNSRNQLDIWFGNYSATLQPQASHILDHWRFYYNIISGANVIINRLEGSELTEAQKTKIEAEAKFFRGLAYRTLGYLWGGVPIELEEVTAPKTDYTRASREQVYQQAVSDLLFAAENLRGVTQVQDGEVTNLAAYHILAEVYVAMERFDEAIQAASVVIDDPNTALMTERFGSRSAEEGDVYWDLFRKGNQNRSAGNTEGILVFQYEVDLLGGGQSSDGLSNPRLERNVAPEPRSFRYTDPNGVLPFINAPVSDLTGGRGIGRMRSTTHYIYTIWEGDWNGDMRNSKYNFIRDVAFNNPESVWFGRMLSEFEDQFRKHVNDTLRFWFPYPSKVTTPNNHPEPLYVNRDLKILANTAGATYTDQYFIRLPESYLLRAEAYLGKGDKINAAADINVVRGRAQAIPATPDEIDIHYILDERLRELGMEERRRLTLSRLGLVYDRVSRLVEGNQVSSWQGLGVEPHHNLWPIPFSEIERNTGSVLEQNPGYSAN